MFEQTKVNFIYKPSGLGGGLVVVIWQLDRFFEVYDTNNCTSNRHLNYIFEWIYRFMHNT